MERNEYQKAFDALSFSDGFQERTAGLLHQRASDLEKERTAMKTTPSRKKIAVLVAACIALLAVSVSAAVMMLSPSDVANEHQMASLAEAFQGKDAIVIDETVESGNFAITLMGLVSGENLKDYSGYEPSVEGSRTYAVLALRSLDGTPLTNQTYDFSRYTMTPLVSGCSPAGVNDWTLNGGASGFAKDGLYYYLLDTKSLEIFADHTVYIAFYEGGVPNNTIFFMDGDGTISFCDDFTGVHALFTIPMDPAKADPAAVEEFLNEFPMGWTNDRTPTPDYNSILEAIPGGSLKTIVPAVPENGTPYTAEDFERDLEARRESWKSMLESGQYTQEYYDEWNQRQEEILAGLRDGSITGVQGQKGDHYFNCLQKDGSPLTPTGEPVVYTDAAGFAVYVESEKARLKQELDNGVLSQATYEESILALDDALEGVQDGTKVAAALPDGGFFVGTTPYDGLEYQLDSDGAVMAVIK